MRKAVERQRLETRDLYGECWDNGTRESTRSYDTEEENGELSKEPTELNG